MSTASSPSRKTITAALVTTVAVLAPSPSVPAPSSSASSRASRVSRTSREGLSLAISLASPSLPSAPNQTSASTCATTSGAIERRLELGSELEKGVGLEPSLLGLAVLARAHGRLQAIEA